MSWLKREPKSYTVQTSKDRNISQRRLLRRSIFRSNGHIDSSDAPNKRSASNNVEPKKFGSFILNNERSTRIPGTRKLDDNNVEPKKFWNFTLNNERSTRIPGTRKLDNSWVYGNSLENLHEASKDDVPKIVRKMVELIEQNKGCAGLYRQSGEKTKMVKIKGIIQKNNISLLDAHSKDTAELACLLKQFFTELKTPLIPYDVLDKFIESYDLDEGERRVRLEKHIKKSLPDPHLAMLEFLLKHLSKVIDDEQNMMSKEALCIVWAPVLFLLKHDNDFDKMTQLLDKAVKLTEMLVDIYAPSDLKIQNRDKCKSGFDEVEVEAVIPDTGSDSDSARHDMETKL